MNPFRIRMPLFSLIPLGICILMGFAGWEILNALRFMQCATWTQLPPAPAKTVALLGWWSDRLYVRAENQTVNCFRQGAWSTCTLPPYTLKPDRAPAWLLGYLEAGWPRGTASQVIRAGGITQFAYYSLSAGGGIAICTAEAEFEGIFNSGRFVWLLLPAVGLVWSGFAFLRMVVDYGRPVIHDGWGGSREIK